MKVCATGIVIFPGENFPCVRRSPTGPVEVEREVLAKLYTLGQLCERVRLENGFSSIRYGTVRFRHLRQARLALARTF